MLRYLRKWLFGTRNRIGQKGIVLPIVLSYSMIFALEAAGLAVYAGSTLMQIQSQENYIRTFYMAEAATEKAVVDVRTFMQINGRPPTALELDAMMLGAPNIGTDFSLVPPDPSEPTELVTVAYDGAATTQTLTSGLYTGLNGSVQTINIIATAQNNLGRRTTNVTVRQDVQIQLIPVFQFGVFYEEDLEILPGPDMNFVGPVHANGDIYMGTGSSSTLTFDSGITAVGQIFHDRKDNPGSVGSGDIMITDSSATPQNMDLGGGDWLDSTHANWTLDSQSLWGGNVRDQEHGTQYLTVPLPTGANPHAIIERADVSDTPSLVDQKMEYKSHIKIIDGVVMDATDTPIELSYCADASTGDDLGFNLADCATNGGIWTNPLSAGTFTNHREGKVIQSLDINVEKLNKSPTFQAIADATPNGVIIYHSETANDGSATDQDALRLHKGSKLYPTGMTVVSENPMYIHGDYNQDDPATVGVDEKVPAGIVADAFNILSNDWHDANSASSDLNDRIASDTAINAAIISGNTDTSVGNYNGGFENIHRFLEDWSESPRRTLTYSGSVTILFQSQSATGAWSYGGSVYTAPTRDWGFDTDLANPAYVVPGFPNVYNIVRTGWELDS